MNGQPDAFEDGSESHLHPEPSRATTAERGFSIGVDGAGSGTSVKAFSVQPSEVNFERDATTGEGLDGYQGEVEEESKDWRDLPMLVKLDSMYLLMEWQFQNPMRLRTLMRSDDENASWVRLLPFFFTSASDLYYLHLYSVSNP